MIRLNCFILTTEHARESILEAARKLTEASLKQDGCIAYDIFESSTRPDVLMICETWRDQESLDAHSDSEPFKEYAGFMKANSEMKLESFVF